MAKTILITGPDHPPFVAAAREVFERIRPRRSLATAHEVAEVTVHAATDPSDRLCYVATADPVPLVTARREPSVDDYLALMRKIYRHQGVG